MTSAGVRLLPSGQAHLDDVIEFVAAAQIEPDRHVTYVGLEAESLRQEFTAIEHWEDRLFVAADRDRIVGVLLADVDEAMRRVWWIGPWAPDERSAIEMLSAARSRLGDLFDEEELAPDSRNRLVRSVARELGFGEDTPSSVLSRDGLEVGDASSTRAMRPEDAGAVADLHDSLFEGTHTPGARLVAATDTRIRTAELDGAIVGYIAYEVQADGTGYIDYVGVAPHARRRGVARALVSDICRVLAGEEVHSVHLTVRTDAPGALDLYRSIGFVEERVIVPCRFGFTLG